MNPILVAATLLVFSICGPIAATSVDSVDLAIDSINGRWIPPNGPLGVFGVNASQIKKKDNKSQVLLEVVNHMPGDSDAWVVASGFLDPATMTIELEVLWFNETQQYVLVSGTLQPSSGPLPTITWNGPMSTGHVSCPAAFIKGVTWSKFGSATSCITNSPFQGVPLSVLDAHHKARGAAKGQAEQHPRGRSAEQAAPNITKVHVVFTQHFDLGYTDFAWCVVSHYFWYIFPGTALTALAMPGYIYTTHPWLLYFFYNCEDLVQAVKPPPGISFVCPSAEVRSVVSQAIRSKQIVWHSFPFDGFNEMLGAEMFDFAFNYADWLEAKFFSDADGASGKLHSMQQVDVPGLYRAQVQFLLNRNVTSLYIGQNPCPTFAGVVPELPNLFMWEPLPQQEKNNNSAAVGNLLLVFTHKLGYGGLNFADAVIDEVSQTAFVVQCTLENHPPYTPEDIEAYLAQVAAEFPSCKPENVIPSTYDAFAADVKSAGWPRKDLLRFQHDMGDAWVRASASDPVKTKAFLSQRRAFEASVGSPSSHRPQDDPQTLNNVLFTMTGCEHNWGLPWGSNWQSAVYSYEEKRGLLGPGNFSSGHGHNSVGMSSEINKNVAAITDFGNSSFQCEFTDSAQADIAGLVSIRFAPVSGAIVTVSALIKNTSSGAVLAVIPSFADEGHRLLEMLYVVHETTGPSQEQSTDGWGDPEPQLVAIASTPEVLSIARAPSGCSFVIVSVIQQTYLDNNTKEYTTPTDSRSMTMTLRTTIDIAFAPLSKRMSLAASLEVVGKLPSDVTSMYQSWNRNYAYGDSFSVQFNPLGAVGGWRVGALGTSYSPYDFAARGTCNYHVADVASAPTTSNRTFSVAPIDSTLLLFGWNNASWLSQVDDSTQLCEVFDETGIWFNLWNQWNANWVVGFPWREDDTESMVFSFNVTIS
jgi:hypothetical protein